MALEVLPTDAAKELKKYAEYSSLEVAKIRCRRHKRKEADADGSEAKKNLASFKEKCEELLSEGSCQAIEMMLRFSGWQAANTRKSETCRRHKSREGYKSDAEDNKREVEEQYQNIIEKKEISETLASNLKEMGYCIAWSKVNSIFCPDEAAEVKEANLDSLFENIHGEVDVAQILSQRPAEEPLKPVDEVPLEILPSDVGNELKLCAEYQSLHCAKKRFRNGGEADADRMKAKDHYDSFKEKCKGLLSGRVCQHIRGMLTSAAWHEANIEKSKQCWLPKLRYRYKSDASKDKNGIHEAYQDIVEAREISQTLAGNLREMVCNVARHAVSKIVGRDDDAVRDTANVDLYFRNVTGTVNLVNMKFIIDEATEIMPSERLVVCEQYLQNKTAIQQTMVFSFTVTEGKTHSTSHTVGFSYGVASSFSAGFAKFGELNFSLEFNFSCDRTFEESMNNAITKAYEFPLSVPAYNTYVAKGIVQKAEMEIPYELVFDLKGARRSVKGLWKGVAYSKANYEIENREGAPTSCSIV